MQVCLTTALLVSFFWIGCGISKKSPQRTLSEPLIFLSRSIDFPSLGADSGLFSSNRLVAFVWSTDKTAHAIYSDGGVVSLGDGAKVSAKILRKPAQSEHVLYCADGHVCWEHRPNSIARVSGTREQVFPLERAKGTALVGSPKDIRLLAVDDSRLVVSQGGLIARLTYREGTWALDGFTLPTSFSADPTLRLSLKEDELFVIKGSEASQWLFEQEKLTLKQAERPVSELSAGLNAAVQAYFSWSSEGSALDAFFAFESTGKLVVKKDSVFVDFIPTDVPSGATPLPAGETAQSPNPPASLPNGWAEVTKIAAEACAACHAPGTTLWADALQESSWSKAWSAKIRARITSNSSPMPPLASSQEKAFTAEKRAVLVAYLDSIEKLSLEADATAKEAAGP